jgi:hypothetical protein
VKNNKTFRKILPIGDGWSRQTVAPGPKELGKADLPGTAKQPPPGTKVEAEASGMKRWPNTTASVEMKVVCHAAPLWIRIKADGFRERLKDAAQQWTSKEPSNLW